MELVKQEYKFTIKFDGPDYIPVDLLCNTLVSFQALSNETPLDAKFTYNVIAHKQGSFEAEISAIATVAPILLSPANINFVLNSLQIVKQWFEIKKHLKGEKPKSVVYEGNSANVENMEGDILQTTLSGASILQNAQANTIIVAIGNTFRGFDRDALSVFSPDNGNIFKINRGDIDYISSDVNYQDQSEQDYCETNRVLLTVIKPDIAGHSQWQFYYYRRIDAKINDAGWLDRVIDGDVFIKGKMRIDADLKSVGKKDRFGIPIEGTVKYSVEKVYGEVYNSDTTGDQTSI